MTQMLLFDSVTSGAVTSGSITSGSLGTDTVVAPIVAVAPAAPASLRGSGNQAANGNEIPEPHVRGLNRMGDLARLVLLRHDLVAAQRNQRQNQPRAGRRAK